MFNVSPTCYTSLLLNTIGTTHAYVDNIHILCLHAVMVSVWAMSIYAGVCDVSECKEKRNCRAVQLFFSTIAAHREQHRAGEQHNDNYNHVVYCLLAAHIIFFFLHYYYYFSALLSPRHGKHVWKGAFACFRFTLFHGRQYTYAFGWLLLLLLSEFTIRLQCTYSHCYNNNKWIIMTQRCYRKTAEKKVTI